MNDIDNEPADESATVSLMVYGGPGELVEQLGSVAQRRGMRVRPIRWGKFAIESPVRIRDSLGRWITS